jgi:Mn-dependent DtxR family transcriptional regulator
VSRSLELKEKVDVARLSPRSRETWTKIAPLVNDGFTQGEIAERLDLDPREVATALRELREELEAQAHGAQLPDLGEDERLALKLSLKRHGQLLPLLVDEEGELLDGAQRLALLEELGIEPEKRVIDLSSEEDREATRRELSLAANLARRQLSHSARRAAIEAEILHDPARSDRLIGHALGVTGHTVASVRAALEARGQVERLDKRVGADGVAQPAGKAGGGARRVQAHVEMSLMIDPQQSYGQDVVFANQHNLLTLAERYWHELGRPDVVTLSVKAA